MYMCIQVDVIFETHYSACIYIHSSRYTVQWVLSLHQYSTDWPTCLLREKWQQVSTHVMNKLNTLSFPFPPLQRPSPLYGSFIHHRSDTTYEKDQGTCVGKTIHTLPCILILSTRLVLRIKMQGWSCGCCLSWSVCRRIIHVSYRCICRVRRFRGWGWVWTRQRPSRPTLRRKTTRTASTHSNSGTWRSWQWSWKVRLQYWLYIYLLCLYKYMYVHVNVHARSVKLVCMSKM